MLLNCDGRTYFPRVEFHWNYMKNKNAIERLKVELKSRLVIEFKIHVPHNK